MTMTLFSDVPPGPYDPMFHLKAVSDGDTSPEKIDVGIGAKTNLGEQNIGHEYLPTTGIQSFLEGATQLLFGSDNVLIKSNRIASVQTVGGTGAVHLGAAFLNRNFPVHSQVPRQPNDTKVYVGVPAWPNYLPLFAHAGFAVEAFSHYDRGQGSVDIRSALHTISQAPTESIFIFQVCCHNPTGQDYDRDQWREIAEAIKPKRHFVFFDMAYQGFASDMHTDAWPVRYFTDQRIDLLVCQSFSKNMGLYSERVGVLHVVCGSSSIAVNVKDQLRSLIRWEFSSTPAYGARLANIVMHNEHLYAEWVNEVQAACDRLKSVRNTLHQLLHEELRTPGSWDHVLVERGLFSYMNLSKGEVARLRQHHVYVADSGRVNIAGLNQGNVERFARAINAVVRETNVGDSSGSAHANL